ncbi:MFS transporter, partial [Ottowia sp.]|uniref:MFS transporter n=1 Tax=Ottowia sp. TaxID=1898956 RepID=UPI0039E21897
SQPAEAAPAGPRGSVWDLLALPPLRRLLLVNWMQAAAWDVHTFVLPILGHERGLSASAIGALLGAFAVAAALVRMALPKIAARLAEWQVILASTLVAAAALALYPLAPGFATMALCSVVLGVALGAVQPMVLSLLHHIAPPARQGEAMALRVMTINLSSFLLPMLFGAVGAVTGVAGLFWLVAAVLGAGARAVVPLKNLG